MKKTSIILTLLALSIPIIGQAEADGDKKTRHTKTARSKIIEKFDTNGDGTLNEAEKATAKEARKAKRKEFIAQHDSDGDGTLSDEEKQNAKEKFYATYDSDGDGKISEAERELAREAGAIFPMHRKNGHQRKKK